MYRVYKASLNEYRILDEATNTVLAVGPNLFLENCEFVVDADGYDDAKARNFKDSGDPLDYFAYIRCDLWSFREASHGFLKKVFFNPFRVRTFVDRETIAPVHRAKFVTTDGNILTYL